MTFINIDGYSRGNSRMTVQLRFYLPPFICSPHTPIGVGGPHSAIAVQHDPVTLASGPTTLVQLARSQADTEP